MRYTFTHSEIVNILKEAMAERVLPIEVIQAYDTDFEFVAVDENDDEIQSFNVNFTWHGVVNNDDN